MSTWYGYVCLSHEHRNGDPHRPHYASVGGRRVTWYALDKP